MAAPVDFDPASIAPGELRTVEWRGCPVWDLHRTPEVRQSLQSAGARLADPQSKRLEQPVPARNPWRSLKPELTVMVGICTHLGCIPTYRPTAAWAPDLGPDWPGGFFCPCHGSRFDVAGRVFRNVPAPLNLEVLPCRFEVDGRVRIGDSA